MSSKGKSRGRKKVQNAPEHIAVENDEETLGVGIELDQNNLKRRGTQNKVKKLDDADHDLPTKRGRGGKKQAIKVDVENEIIGDKNIVEDEVKPKRGMRKTKAAAIVKNQTEESGEEIESAEEVLPVKVYKSSRSRKIVESVAPQIKPQKERKGAKNVSASKASEQDEVAQESHNNNASSDETRVNDTPPKKVRSRKAPLKKTQDVVETIVKKSEESANKMDVKKVGNKSTKEKDIAENGFDEQKKATKRVGAKKPATGGRIAKKRGAPAAELSDDDFVNEPTEGKKPKTKAGSTKANQTKTPYSSINFDINKDYNFKISSWNVAGLRALILKGGLEYVDYEKPDILCLQEIKCTQDLIPDAAKLHGYHKYWLCKEGGHAGVALYSKIMPINVEYGIGDPEQDESGRILTAEYEKFFLINVYVPNSGRKLVTLSQRLRWNQLFQDYVLKLNNSKPVIICGDMNVSHKEIDLTNPKSNKRNAGFTQEERDGMTELLSHGLVDSFRHYYPNQEKAYTFWSYMMNSRAKNVGWRLDYFIISERFISKTADVVIRSEVLGSDHCPITLFLKL